MDNFTKFLDKLPFSEKRAVEELRSRLSDDLNAEMKEDIHTFLRFLRARDFNLDKSEDMLRKHIGWRKTVNFDNIMDCTIPAVVSKYFPFSRLGYDKDGFPLRYFAVGDLDGKGIFKSSKKADVMKWIYQILYKDVEILKQQSKKLHKPIEQWTYIFDCHGFNLAKATHKYTVEIAIAIFMMYEANFPERLKTAYIVNASVYFALVFSILKPLLSGATLKKVKIFSSDGYREELLKAVDADVLPAFLGGTRTDPNGNPLCKTIITTGGYVPEEYFVPKECTLSKEPDVKKLTVTRMSKHNIVMEVTEPCSFIEWEFETESKDIGFGLQYKESKTEPKLKELIPKQRTEAHISAEVGMFKCEKPGIYILMFDNTYSWLQQKEIYCRVAVVTPLGKRISAFK